MKYVLAVLMGILVCGTVDAATTGRFGGQREGIPRSSSTASSDGINVIARGEIVLRRIVVGVPVTGSSVTFFDTDFSTNIVPIEQSYDTDTWGDLELHKYFKNGLAYQTSGGATPARIDIQWEWLRKPTGVATIHE